MRHEAIAQALCGRYTRLTDKSGYLESHFVFPHDGTLLGAYVVEQPADTVVVTDDGNVAFMAAAAGAEITPSRASRYREVAARYGIDFDSSGRLSATCDTSQLPFVVANFFLASSEIARASVKHRPGDEERFERTIGELLYSQFRNRLQTKPRLVGLSGHQLQFPFGIDMDTDRPAVVQPIAAADGGLSWHSIYSAGGKFKDLTSLRSDVRLIAILEDAPDVNQASNYFADTADVYIYRGEHLPIRLAS